MKTTPVQAITGETAEAAVGRHLSAIGLTAQKPSPDNGIDLNVSLPAPGSPGVKIQIKGLGPNQTNWKFRWFQVRMTSAHRERASLEGLPPADTWEKKVRMCDFFVLVAQRYNEFWILPQEAVIATGTANVKSTATVRTAAQGNKQSLTLM